MSVEPLLPPLRRLAAGACLGAGAVRQLADGRQCGLELRYEQALYLLIADYLPRHRVVRLDFSVEL